MAEERRNEPSTLRLLRKPVTRDRRRRLPLPVRYLIIAAAGALIAALASYLLRKLGL